jgi:hypothetical protein
MVMMPPPTTTNGRFEPGTSSLAEPPLFAVLSGARSVLIAGAGGGFDVYAGLPLAIALWTEASPCIWRTCPSPNSS